MVALARVIEAAETGAVQCLGYADMEPEQLQAVSGIISGQDVYAVLPTGFEKSLYFAYLPAVFDWVLPIGEPSTVLVVTRIERYRNIVGAIVVRSSSVIIANIANIFMSLRTRSDTCVIMPFFYSCHFFKWRLWLLRRNITFAPPSQGNISNDL